MMLKQKPQIDLSFAKAATLLPPAYDRLRLFLVGCGGTGSWLAPSVARIARVLQDKNRPVEVFFIDHDTVEQKNIPRQNFCQAELGANKAETLARRFSAAWGVEIQAIPRRFSAREFHGRYADLCLVIGCVDNAAARQEIANAVGPKTGANRYNNEVAGWWLDCGNSESSGQVLLGSETTGKGLAGVFASRKICRALPAPSLVAPDLLVPRPEEAVASRLSCAEIQLANDQSLAVNQMVAGYATGYLLRFCFGGLRKFATYFDDEAGSARSRYITPEEIGAVARKPVEYLIAAKK
jgi:PRTRC genetic system ThiF family protein